MAKEKKTMGVISKASLRVKKVFILHGWTHAEVDNTDPLKKWESFLSEMRLHNMAPSLLQIPGLTSDNDKVYNLNKYFEWLSKTLEKEDEKIILMGHSNGGRIAAFYAAKKPEKIKHLVLIDSAGIFSNRLPGRIKRVVFKSLAKIGKKFTTSENLKKLLHKLAGEGDYRRANPAQRQTMLNLIYLDLKDVFQKIKVPTLIVWGRKDKITPLSDGQLIHSLIKNSKLFVIDDARHVPQFTHPKEVVQKILKEVI